MTSREQPRCRLLQLPKELRLVMYENTFIKTEDAVPLLQSCRQFHNDALSTFYHSPASFSSQAKFFNWLDRSSDANLRHITKLKLILTDIDLSALFDVRSTMYHGQRPTLWTLCNSVLQKLRNGLQRLSNLTVLTITPPENPQVAFREAVYQPLLASLPIFCPQVQTLVLHDDEDLLKSVPTLRRLPDVRITKDLPRSHHFDIDDRMKNNASPAAVDFEDMLEMIHPGRRALSEPAVSPSRFASKSPQVEGVSVIKRERI